MIQPGDILSGLSIVSAIAEELTVFAIAEKLTVNSKTLIGNQLILIAKNHTPFKYRSTRPHQPLAIAANSTLKSPTSYPQKRQKA
jgi:hypothetical protein